MGRWSDRLQDLGRKIADLVRDLAGAHAQPEPALVPVPVRSGRRGPPAPPEPRFR